MQYMNKLKFLLIIAAIVVSGCTMINRFDTQTNRQPASQVNEAKPADSTTATKNKIDLSGQGLAQVSQDIFKMTNLVELDVSGNNLTGALPAEIRQLQKLEILNAADNQMTGVPAEVGQLQNLRVLNLANNQLTGLPYELANLKNLEVLNLSGNNYSTQDLEIIRQGLPKNINIIL